MEKDNAKYKKQGIHVITNIFTVEKGVTKVLLIERKNDPFKGMWALVGGALYNNEDLLDGVQREIKEKTGITDIDIYFSGAFGEVDRSPIMRMIALSYIGVIDSAKVGVLKDSLKTSNAEWFEIDNLPKLAYDHASIAKDALEKLKNLIVSTDILKSLFPNGFTLPELQKTYETILGVKFDRRNFRKKIINLDLITDTNKSVVFEGKKPAKLYKFKKKGKKEIIF